MAFVMLLLHYAATAVQEELIYPVPPNQELGTLRNVNACIKNSLLIKECLHTLIMIYLNPDNMGTYVPSSLTEIHLTPSKERLMNVGSKDKANL